MSVYFIGKHGTKITPPPPSPSAHSHVLGGVIHIHVGAIDDRVEEFLLGHRRAPHGGHSIEKKHVAHGKCRRVAPSRACDLHALLAPLLLALRQRARDQMKVRNLPPLRGEHPRTCQSRRCASDASTETPYRVCLRSTPMPMPSTARHQFELEVKSGSSRTGSMLATPRSIACPAGALRCRAIDEVAVARAAVEGHLHRRAAVADLHLDAVGELRGELELEEVSERVLIDAAPSMCRIWWRTINGLVEVARSVTAARRAASHDGPQVEREDRPFCRSAIAISWPMNS